MKKLKKKQKKSKKLNNMKKLEKNLIIKYIGKTWKDEKIGKNNENKKF